MKQTKRACFVFFTLFKKLKVIFYVVVYAFFGLERLTTKNELFGVLFKLFLDSLNMKRFPSEISFFHTR